MLKQTPDTCSQTLRTHRKREKKILPRSRRWKNSPNHILYINYTFNCGRDCKSNCHVMCVYTFVYESVKT